MIPMCLVTGFLGSGKTTLLRHIIARHAGERIVYLVNEFSPLDLDAALLEREDEDVVAIPGGSIFCQCLVTQFVGHLKCIPERFHSREEPVRGVVVEASGIANPMVVEQMLAETRLDEVYDLASVISIVDPGSLPKLVHTLPSIRAQVEAADIVLVNKTDLFEPGQVDAAEAIVREISPQARIIRTVRCRVDLDIFASAHVKTLSGEYACGADPNFARFSVAFEESVDIERLRRELQALEDEIYRAKGFVPTGNGMIYLDMSPAGLTVEPADGDEPWQGLVLVARGADHAGTQELVRRIDSGDLSAD
ncbi:MAG: CobW family GTP-binding protein [Armatimonadota bacterium]